MSLCAFRRPPRASVRLAHLVLALLATVAWARTGFAQEGEAAGFENLKVLPAHISEDRLDAIMGAFTDALGVSCTHCHVRRDGQPPDFPADDKPEKETARAMMRMVEMINGWHLADLPTVDGRSLPVNCMTCHRGLARPQALDHLLADYVPAHGVEASLAKYDSLRADYYGAAAYDFSDASLVRLARRLLAADRPADALAFLERNLELHPASTDTYVAMADVHLHEGDRAAAVASLERAVALDPEDRRLARRLDEVRGQD